MDDDGSRKIAELFEKSQHLHRTSYPNSPVDFDALNVTTKVARSRYLIGRGHFSDVYKGTFAGTRVVGRLPKLRISDPSNIHLPKIAVKVLRLPVYDSTQDELYEAFMAVSSRTDRIAFGCLVQNNIPIAQRFFRELNHWNGLRHLNVVQMLGYTYDEGDIGFVSLLYPKGDLLKYLKANPDASKPDLTLDVADGLQYLHNSAQPLIHGDLKALNVLVGEDGIACIGDFGISKLVHDLDRKTGFTTNGGAGTIPWMAPELFQGERVSLASDIYSFGVVIIEIWCEGKSPYHYMNLAQTAAAKSRGLFPDRQHYPEVTNDKLWRIMGKCWNKAARNRPSINEVKIGLHRLFKLSLRADDGNALYPRTSFEPVLDGRYVTPKNAQLTYTSAISSLHELCHLFPTDIFTPILAPRYTVIEELGYYQASVTLPSALPLPRHALFYESPPRCISQRIAKGGAAFNAVKALHALKVFDDDLLPAQKSNANIGHRQDADGNVSMDISMVEKMIEVNVRDPWGNPWAGGDVWLHPIIVSDRPVAGLVTGVRVAFGFPHCFNEHGEHVRLGEGVRLSFADDAERLARLIIMWDYSREGCIWGISTSRKARRAASVMVVLLQEDLILPDYEAMEAFVWVWRVPWTRETHLSQSAPILARHRRTRQALLFTRVRDDLTPQSRPFLFPDQRNHEEGYSSYIDYYRKIGWKLAGKSNFGRANLREDDLMLEFKELRRPRTKVKMLRSCDCETAPQPQLADGPSRKDSMTIIPQSALFQLKLPLEILGIFHLLPHLIRHVTFYYHAHIAQQRLSFPALDMTRHMEGLTLPSTGAGFDYRRLRTLGDSCLKMATSVHIFTKFPHHHKGQLTSLRLASTSNVYLLGRALESSLYEFINGGASSLGRPGPRPLVKDVTCDEDGNTMVHRLIRSKAMRHCLKASLGVAWLSGSMDAVLKVGTALKLCFGGAVPWMERSYQGAMTPSETYHAFRPVEEALGYHFRNPSLLSEALTHQSSSTSNTGSYGRLEFLGCALVELFLVQHIFHRWPNAQPEKLSRIRETAMCNTTLSAVAIKVLSLDRVVLHGSSLLPDALKTARVDFENEPFVDVINNTWRYEPPKVLQALTKSVLGAMFADSNFDLKKSFEVVAHVMSSIIEALHFDIPEHPTTEMLRYLARHGCVKGEFRERKGTPGAIRIDCTAVLIHGHEVVPPVPAINPRVSKSYTCARALEGLRSGEIDLVAICTCREVEAVKLSPSPKVETGGANVRRNELVLSNPGERSCTWA